MASKLKVPKLARSVSAPPKSLVEILQNAEASLESTLEGFTSSLNTVLEEEDIPGPVPKMSRSLTDGCVAEVTFLANLEEYLAKLASKHEVKTDSSAAIEAKVAAPLCSICFEEFKIAADVVRVCDQPECDKTFCKPCLSAFIKSAINSGYGTCPVLKCPGCNLFLSFVQWKEYAEEADRTKYAENAKQILTLQCGNCHTRGTLLQPSKHTETARAEAFNALMTELQTQLGEEKGSKVTQAFQTYCKAGIGPVQFMQVLVPNCVSVQAAKETEEKLTELRSKLDTAEQALAEYDNKFQTTLMSAQTELKEVECAIEETEAQIASTQDELVSMRLSNQLVGLRSEMTTLLTSTRKIQSIQEMSRSSFLFKLGIGPIRSEIERLQIAPVEIILGQLMPKLLEVTPDQERRSTLHLRYCLMFPFVTSLCCNYVHCFKCKTKGLHEGKTCEENQSALPTEIRNCPQCNTALVKGDGCASIRCVCGHSFSWTSATVTT